MASSNTKKAKCKGKTAKKDKASPPRPLSAYNVFFKVQRHLIIHGKPDLIDPEIVNEIIEKTPRNNDKAKRLHRKSHGKISFANLAKTISHRWRECDKSTKSIFEEIAKGDKERYFEECSQFKCRRRFQSKEITDWNYSGPIGVKEDAPAAMALRSSRTAADLECEKVGSNIFEPLPFTSSEIPIVLDKNACEYLLSVFTLGE